MTISTYRSVALLPLLALLLASHALAQKSGQTDSGQRDRVKDARASKAEEILNNIIVVAKKAQL
ncbi:MAG: hypothetical protein VB934_07730 [Polyangiaceae bacterium]